MNFIISAEFQKAFSLASHQNEYPLFRDIFISYEKSEAQPERINEIIVKLKIDEDVFEEEIWEISEINEGESIPLQKRNLKIDLKKLTAITEIATLQATISIFSKNEEELISKYFYIDILPQNYWGGESRQPELLSAFVKPNGVFIESIVRKTTELLEKNGFGRSADGYQSQTREKPYAMAASLWAVISSMKLSYVVPPASFATTGQRIRLPSEISTSKSVSCLDGSLLFASCLEAMGLNPIIGITKEHAFVGCWLIDNQFTVVTNDDPIELRKRVDAQDLIIFETTLITYSNVIFSKACDDARRQISEENESNFVYYIDIFQARSRKIKPIFTKEERPNEEEALSTVLLEKPLIPKLPPVRKYEKENVEETPDSRVDSWKRKLLDLSKRNPLLNLSSRAICVNIYCPDIGGMEDELAKGSAFKFISTENSPIKNSDRAPELFRLKEGDSLHEQFALEQLKKQVLVANLNKSLLEKQLTSLLRKSKTDLETGGANTLFLALGFLKWRDSPDSKTAYRAPLILIPVGLKRKSAKAPIYVQQTGENQTIFNLTLIEFLKLEYEIDLSVFRDNLPKDHSGVDVDLIWQTVREKINEENGFEVVKDLVLGSFSFAKYLMWKDLSERVELLKNNLFVKHMIDTPKVIYTQNFSAIPQERLDKELDFKNVFTPLNCDSSQLRAVIASEKPQDFVLEGPPGTGKSETIANIICHNIGKGKKVLFVAEKMAALNVVYKRIKRIGLESLCLELHSNKSNKKYFFDQLNKSIEEHTEGSEDWDNINEKLSTLKNQLNAYVDDLHNTETYGFSARKAIGVSVLNRRKNNFCLEWNRDFEDKIIRNKDYLNNMISSARLLGNAYRDIETINFNCFKSINQNKWSFGWQSEVTKELANFISKSNSIKDLSIEIFNLIDSEFRINIFSKLEGFIELFNLHSLSNKREINYAVRKGGAETIEALKKVFNEFNEIDKIISGNSIVYSISEIHENPFDEWSKEYSLNLGSFIKRWLVTRKINKTLKTSGFEKIKDFENLKKISHVKIKINNLIKIFEELKKSRISVGINSNKENIKTLIDDGTLANKLSRKSVSIFENKDPVIKYLKVITSNDKNKKDLLYQKVSYLSELYNEFQDCEKKLKDLKITFNSGLIDRSISDAEYLIEKKNQYKPWCEWVLANEGVQLYNIQNLSKALLEKKISPEHIESEIKTAFYKWAAEPLLDRSDNLRTFKSSNHELLISDYVDTDKNVAQISSDKIKILAKTKKANFHDKNVEEYKLISSEYLKKKNQKSIRLLLSQVGESVLDICPCFMMSPLSVAQFLPPEFNGFDLVVFDEASQITPWDSIGAIARGKNVIIVGDPKQMPPTNFFNTTIDPDDTEEEDLESILDQALAAGLPHLRLTGHYRSRHETLIAFSNSKYYENSLVTFPSSDTKEMAVTLRRVDGVYSKGKLRNNPIEAKAVVDEVYNRLISQETNNLSIGIVTLNTEQQRTIEDLLDDRRRSNPEIEKYFRDGENYDSVFVKNLESVQGDERDVIILSLAYGPTELESPTMSINFGPLNKPGGERRLNVALTRATTEVVVFSSFDSSMIDLNRTSSIGVEHLKHYLEFAEKGITALAKQTRAKYGIDQFDSDFEQAVANDLRNKGWIVQTQIGVSKFRIDLGIINPIRQGVYLAGIECDGATYHSHPSARDRDIIRQKILENLGWKILRIWSTDYFVDPEGTIEKICEKLEIALVEFQKREEEIQAKENETVEEDVLINEPQEFLSDEEDIESEEVDSNENEEFQLTSPELNRHQKESLSEEFTEIYGILVPNSILNQESYFDKKSEEYQKLIIESILSKKRCCTFHSLAQDLAYYFNMRKTSKKQLKHILHLIDEWAGFGNAIGELEVVWLRKADVCDEYPWKGLYIDGEKRDINDIPFPEARGLARKAIEISPEDPLNFIIKELKIVRKHKKTIEKIESWIIWVKAKNSAHDI